MKKLLGIILPVITLLTLAACMQVFALQKTSQSTVTDEPSGWAEEEVDEANALGLVPSAINSHYTQNINRLEFCDLIAKLIKIRTGKEAIDYADSDSSASLSFPDTNSDNVIAAAKLGIVNGRTNGKFDPYASISRQEAAKMLALTAKVLGCNVTAPASDFSDQASFAAWAKQYIDFVSYIGIMNGTGNNRFSPAANYTREQSILTVYRLYNKLPAQSESDDLPSCEVTSTMLFYRPTAAAVADVIPFYDQGKFRLFYLRGITSDGAFGCSWYQINTADLLNYEELGVSLEHGGSGTQDQSAITGSIIKVGNTYHVFYTGWNSDLSPTSVVMHATSTDLMNWTKIPEDTLYPDPGKYEAGKNNSFRDPFVYYIPEDKKYYMLLAVREKNTSVTEGYTAIFSSADLKKWKDEGKFFAPNLYHTHECPDLFKIGGWWYLVYSEYTGGNMTRYAMSKDLKNWTIPENDALDGRAYYAAKSATDGKSRYLFGWIPTKAGRTDTGDWEWGGSMGVYEVYQKADFTLGLRMPKTIKDSFVPTSKHNDVTIKDGSEQIFTGSADTGYRIDGTIKYTDSKEFGITFGRDYKNNKGGYQFSFNPSGGLLKFDAIGRQINTKGIERPITIKPAQNIKFSLIIEGEVAVLYVNDEIVLSSRIYEPAGNDIGFYSSGGSASVTDLEMLTFKG